MTLPQQIKTMLSCPGVYVVGQPGHGEFVVIYVSPDGKAQQMKLDGYLSDDGWKSDVVVCGPLSMAKLARSRT